MTQLNRVLSFVLVLVIEAFVTVGFVFDWVWFGTLEILAFVPVTGIAILIFYAGTFVILILWHKQTGEWGFNLAEGRSKDAFLIGLVLVALVLMNVNTWEARDLNEVYHIPHNNSERQYTTINDTSYVFYESGIANVTSDDSARVVMWLDMSYFNNATYVYFGYYNGTTFYEGENRTTELGHPSLYWWTEFNPIWFYHPESPIENPFGNDTDHEFVPFTIPAHKANTTVEYALVCRTQNGSDISYFVRGGNFTVLYSQSENDFNSALITRSHFFTGLAILLLVGNIVLCKSVFGKESEDYGSERTAAEAAGIFKADPETSQDSGRRKSIQPSYPSTLNMVQRSDRIDDIKNNYRNTSGIFMGLSVGFLLYLQSQRTLQASLPLMSMGVALAILANLYGLVKSLSDITIKGNDGEISYDMIPPKDNENEFRFMVYRRILKQLSVIKRIRQSMQAGVLAILCGFLGDVARPLFIPWEVMGTSGLAIIIFAFCGGMMTFAVILAALWTIKELGISFDFRD